MFGPLDLGHKQQIYTATCLKLIIVRSYASIDSLITVVQNVDQIPPTPSPISKL